MDCQRFFLNYESYKIFKLKYGILLGNLKLDSETTSSHNESFMVEASSLKLCGYKAKITPNLLESKVEKFKKNEDVANEFAYWIENKKYLSDKCVIINGYTAEKLSHLSSYLVGEASFLLLTITRT